MAITIYMDKVEGASATARILAGTDVTRVVTLTDLPFAASGANVTLSDGSVISGPNAAWDTGKMFQTCIDAVALAVGGLGSACPHISSPNYLEAISPQSVDVDKCVVRLVYKGFPKLQIEFSTCLEEVDSNTDKDGALIYVSYTYPAGYQTNPNNAGQTLLQGAFIPKKVPETTLSFTYILSATGTPSASAIVLNFSQTYVGTVNADPWPILSYPGQNGPRTWLCESVRARSQDGGVTYTITISYHYRPQTWDFLLVYINPDDGRPPPGGSGDPLPAADGVWHKTVRGYKEGPMPSVLP